MARRVEDVALAFDVLRGVPPQPLNPDALRGERVAFWYSDGTLPGSGAIRGGVAAAVAALREAGMEPIHSAPAARRMASTGWCAYIQANERQAWAQGFGNGEVWSPLTELLRSLRGEPRIAPGSLLAWLMMHAGGLLAQLLNIDGVSWREELRSQLERLIGARGVAVSPVFPFTAPHHGWTRHWLAAATTSSYTMWVNLAGLPGLTVPVGRSARSGLPVGVQLVGVPGSEQTLLAAGLVVQRALMPEWRGPLL
jgi:Asp-tRNA(Asn)/Glu-tRNA(Gln) amidotransferase A subunit family amidase